MKKRNQTTWLRAVSRCLLAVMLISALTTVVMPPVFAWAEEAVAEEAYEAKKEAYRKKLMEDDVTTDDLLIGSWVSFYSFEKDSYEYQLDQMAAAGLNFNMFPRDFGSGVMFDADYWNNVEEQYAKRNMVYLMNGNMDAANIAPGVEYAANKAHCIGYHVVDEPPAGALPAVGEMVRAYRAADGTRYPMVNLFPSYVGPAGLGGTYRDYVQGFVDAAGAENIEYLSHDYYIFGAGGNNNLGIFADMEVIRSVAYENGKLKTHAFPQSTAWNGMRMPNIDEMRWNVYAYLAYGFKGLSWFNLVCPGSSDNEGEGFRDSIIYRDGTIRDKELFAAWSELNWEVRGLSEALMNLDTVHAYHTRNNVSGVEYLPSNFIVTPSRKMDLVISYMEAKDGSEPYIMIFNKSLNQKKSIQADFVVDFSSGIEGIEYLDPYTGEYIPMDISDGHLEDSFKTGEGKLYRLKGNIRLPEEPKTPTVNLESGFYAGAQTVTLTPVGEGDTLYYTLDGTYPTAASTPYTAPIVLGETGKSSFHTLRVAAARGEEVSPAATYTYVIDGRAQDGSNAHALATAPAATLAQVGQWSNENGVISLTGDATAETLNYYLDGSTRYTDFDALAHFTFAEACADKASVGFLLKATEGDGYLYVGITQAGKLYATCNGTKLSLPLTDPSLTSVGNDLTFRVVKAGQTLRIEVNGQLWSEVTSDDISIGEGILGVNGSQGAAFSVKDASFVSMEVPPVTFQAALTELQLSGTCEVSVPRGTAKEDILALLIKTANGVDENGLESTYDVVWDMEDFDVDASGIYTVRGYPVLPEEGLTVNPHKLYVCATVQIQYTPDRTELNSAIALADSLREADYSAESWQLMREYYTVAAELLEGDFPQNAVTVAAMQLMEKIQALDPTGIDFSKLDAAIAALKEMNLSGMTEASRTAAEEALAKGEAFVRRGPVTQAEVDALTDELNAAKDALTLAETPKGGCRSTVSGTLLPLVLLLLVGSALWAGRGIKARR